MREKHANVAFFVPHLGCPNQCSFCDQREISGAVSAPTAQEVEDTCARALKELGERAKGAQIAFFGGSFTAIDPAYQRELLGAAAPFVGEGGFSGIRLSTRPDAIDKEILAMLRHYGVTAVELGAQSMDDTVLEKNRRGHSAQAVRDASRLIKGAGLELGLQMMLGLYGDTPQGAMETARAFAELGADTVRIYPTVVLRHTQLEQLYRSGEYLPMEFEETVELAARLLEFFGERGIRVIRCGLHDSPSLRENRVAGAYHPAFRELCEARLFLRRALCLLEAVPPGEITLEVNPRNLSRMTGQRRCNLLALEEKGYRAKVKADPALSGDAIRLIQNR